MHVHAKDVLTCQLPHVCCTTCACPQSLFMSMDKDNDGRLSASDLHRAIEQVSTAGVLAGWGPRDEPEKYPAGAQWDAAPR